MLQLEDNYGDIIGKAMRGLGIADSALAQKTGLHPAQIASARSGEFHPDVAPVLAKALQLNPVALAEIGTQTWHPHVANVIGVQQIHTPYGNDGSVNCYLVWNPPNHAAALFDTGTRPGEVLDFLDKKQLKLEYIFLTHTHGDHIQCLPQIQIATGATVYVHRRGDIGGVKLFDWGEKFKLGSLNIETRQTTGHAADGTTYVISGLEKPVAIVGDALFAGSMGGGLVSYREALTTNLKHIYNLPGDALLCPGHGPLTTVAQEKSHNPFYQPNSI